MPYPAHVGIMRKGWEWLTVGFAADETPPRPIAEVLLQMSGAGLLPRVSRAEALSVPAVLRGRNMIAALATLPLVQYDAEWDALPLPLLQQIDPDVPNVVTLAQTFEDLFFDGISWWRVLAFGADGYPVSAQHVDVASVSLQPPGGHYPAPLPSGQDPRDAVVYLDGYPVPAAEIIRFDSPNPGLLHAAGRPVRRAVLLDTTSALYADNPRPQDYFTPADGNPDPASDDAIRTLLDDWHRARKARVTGYVPAALKYNAVDTPTPADLQLIEMQRKASLDLANAMGLDPEDLGISTTSRTYQNGVDRRQDRVNDVLASFMAAVTDRLSMPDITKRGKVVRFDLDDYLKADPKTRWEVYAIGKSLGALNVPEIRRKERLRTFTPAEEAMAAPVQPAAAPAPQQQAAKLSADAPMHLSFETSFTVDQERRTLEGLAVPYGPTKVAMKNGRKWRFQQGSLVPAEDIGRNKLLRDHDFSQPQGALTFFEDRPEGMFARYKVGRGPEGDRTLAEATDRVRDGLSVGVDIINYSPDPLNRGAFLVAVGGAVWYETSVLAVPAFDDARITRVAATKEDSMETCATCGVSHNQGAAHTCATPPESTNQPEQTPAVRLSNDQLQGLLAVPGVLRVLAGIPAAPEQQQTEQFGLMPAQIAALVNVPGVLQMLLGQQAPEQAPEQRPVVNPTRRPTAAVAVREEPAYRFDKKGNLTKGKFDFSGDIIQGFQGNTEALERAQKFMRETYEAREQAATAQFATTMADAAPLNPNIQRPDLYVDQKEFEYPIWNVVSKGTIADATPFVLPKFSSSSGLVGAHTENTEPTPGVFTATAQTITPSAVSGKVEISREAWDQGGNPQLSGLIWRQMERAWYEALEASAVALLEAAAPTTITITTAAADSALEASLTSQLAPLQFIRGGFRMRDAFTQVDLYKALIAAKDSNGRKLFPVLGAQNASGTTNDFFSAVLVAGLVMRPAWALAATSANTANSYLFDRGDVSGWATAPQRLTFENISVAKIHVGIWGYKALAITDVTGVRRLAYDPV